MAERVTMRNKNLKRCNFLTHIYDCLDTLWIVMYVLHSWYGLRGSSIPLIVLVFNFCLWMNNCCLWHQHISTTWNMIAPIFLHSCSILLQPTYIYLSMYLGYLFLLLCCRFWLVLWALCVINHHWNWTGGFDCCGLGSNDILRFSRWQILLKLLSWLQCT